MNEHKSRILGYDFARALAIIGMVFVNFKVVMETGTDSGFLNNLIDSITGKAAALFVVLAGIGMTLMFQSAQQRQAPKGLITLRFTLMKRALFLFVAGISYYLVWPADILHYYAVYIFVGLWLIAIDRKTLIVLSVVIMILFMFLCVVFDYEKGWNWFNMEYYDFFTIRGFIRNLFFNGFHPVLPWVGFLLTGIWLGRLDLKNRETRKNVMRNSIIFYGITKVLSYISILLVSTSTNIQAEDINAILGTKPMPPFIFYMLSGICLSVFIICLSVSLTERYKTNIIIKQLTQTGRMALSIYVGHVLIGMLGLYLVKGALEKSYTIEFIAIYASLFCIMAILFSNLWLKKFKHGPLEYLMRKITG